MPPPQRRDPSILQEPSGPLRPLDLHVLLTLIDGPCHGYGIVKAIEERTDGAISLVPGNLYPILNRMKKAGLIQPAPVRPEDATAAGKQRRNYAVTQAGQDAARHEAIRLQRLVAEPSLKRLLTEPPGGPA